MDHTLVSLVIPLAAIVASLLTTMLTFRHQRKLASDDRLWHHQVTLYVDLLSLEPEHYDDLSRFSPDFAEWFDQSVGVDQLRALTARVDALATNEVRDLWTSLVHRASDLSIQTDMLAAPNMKPEAEATLDRLEQALMAGYDDLRARIRWELGVEKRGTNPAPAACVSQ